LSLSPCELVSPTSVTLWDEGDPVRRSGEQNGYSSFIASRGELDRELIEEARSRGVTVAIPSRLIAARPVPAGGHELSFRVRSGIDRVRARFVIDASGRHRAFSRRAGARLRRWDALVGLTRWLEPRSPEPAELTELHVEAVRDGWWAALSLPDGTISATYFTFLTMLRDGGVRPSEGWSEALDRSELVASRMPEEAFSLGPVRAYPAAPVISEPLFGGDWLAIGDAAVQYDPLEGKGVARALQSGVEGAALAQAAPEIRAELSRDYAASQRTRLWQHCRGRRLVYRQAASRLGPDFLRGLEASGQRLQNGASSRAGAQPVASSSR
jgi:flavin-dependent dehydrogenase